MKNLKSTKPLIVSTIDRAYKFTMANGAFSNGHYTALAASLYVALRQRFIEEFSTAEGRNMATDVVLTNVAWGRGDFSNFGVVKTSSFKTGNGVAIGCMRFSQNALHKIAKFVGFGKNEVSIYFPKTKRTAAGKPKYRTVIVGKAKAARVGR